MARKPIDSDRLQMQELQQELLHAAQELRDAYEKFNLVSEAELVEACVYEINSLKARYNYLLRRYKELSCPTAVQPESAVEEAYVAASVVKGGDPCRS